MMTRLMMMISTRCSPSHSRLLLVPKLARVRLRGTGSGGGVVPALALRRCSARRSVSASRGGAKRPPPPPSSSSTTNYTKQQQRPPPRPTTASTTSTSTSTPNESDNMFASDGMGRSDDGLARYPHLRSPGGVLRGLDYLGTVAFALTGSVTAAQSGLDVFGCSVVGMVTAVGGGTIRDAVFLSRRPFWTLETEYIWMTVVTAFATFYLWPSVIERQDDDKRRKIDEGANPDAVQYDEVDAVLDTFDSIGLAAFAVIGAQNGVRAGVPIAVSALCGMATSTFGGLTRDVLCGRPVRIVHSNAEVYAQPALAGAATYLGAKRIGASPAVRIGAAMAICMGSRYWAVRHDVKLHTWDTKNDGLGVAVRK